MRAIANIYSISNKNLGFIIFEQKRTTLHISFRLRDLEPKKVYAIHIHEFGDISNGCQSLGSHFNPTNKQHFHSELGHAGDLFNNFQTNHLGNFTFNWETNKLSLNTNDISCIIGRSVVIHNFSDDLGQKGIFIRDKFKLYNEMTLLELQNIYSKLGYLGYLKKFPNRNVMLEKLEKESVTTGNASTRIAYGIIGWTK